MVSRSVSVLISALLLAGGPAPGWSVSALESVEPPAPVPGAAGVELPGTAAGRCARDFVALLNAGTPGAARAFEERWASKARLANVGLEERVQRGPSMKEAWAPAVVTEVLKSAESSITVLVLVKGGRTAEMEFQFSPEEPGKLDAVMIATEDAAESRPVSEDDRVAVIRGAARVLTSSYVYPEVAERMAESVLARLEAGEYDGVKDEAALARKLTADFRAVSRDKHLRVSLAPEGAGSGGPIGLPPAERMRQENYAFRKVEVLPGNIGYLRFDLFMDNDQARQAATDALGFLRNCDALIFDVRANGGGSPEMIRYITSYLFEKPTHLNDMVDREGNTVEEYWTLESVPGPRFAPDLPVYVLTSGRTFSGAEEFSYNLRNLGRATLIGETTGGGAHPVRPERINERFVVGVPYMRACNPISKTNWEGTGVEPHIAVPAERALERAEEEARRALEARRKEAPANPKG